MLWEVVTYRIPFKKIVFIFTILFYVSLSNKSPVFQTLNKNNELGIIQYVYMYVYVNTAKYVLHIKRKGDHCIWAKSSAEALTLRAAFIKHM